MNRTLLLAVLCSTLGCAQPRAMPPSTDSTSVQLFNESVLCSSPTDSIPMLLPNDNARWVPQQVILDYKDNACYGAMVHYSKSDSFEHLRDAINTRFSKNEVEGFGDDPDMGLWRIEDSQFAIQLTDDDDSYVVAYVCFVDPDTVISTPEHLHETEPDLFDDVDLPDLVDRLNDLDSAVATPDGG